MEIGQQVFEIALDVYDSMNLEGVIPYVPSTGEEWNIFECNWCSKCTKIFQDCQVALDGVTANQNDSLVYAKNQPTCTAFVHRFCD